MSLRTIAFMGVAGIASLGLVGTGAQGAQLTGTPQAARPKEIDVVLSSPFSPGCTSAKDGCTSLNLASVGPVGSRFDTTPSVITITNESAIPVREATFRLSDTTNGTRGNYLQDEMYLCVASGNRTPGNGAVREIVLANGPLLTGLSLGTVDLLGPTLAANGGTDKYSVDFYTGEDSAVCGTTWSDGPYTASSWSKARYPARNRWVAPVPLTSAAEGGSVTVTVTFGYTSNETYPRDWPLPYGKHPGQRGPC